MAFINDNTKTSKYSAPMIAQYRSNGTQFIPADTTPDEAAKISKDAKALGLKVTYLSS